MPLTAERAHPYPTRITDLAYKFATAGTVMLLPTHTSSTSYRVTDHKLNKEIFNAGLQCNHRSHNISFPPLGFPDLASRQAAKPYHIRRQIQIPARHHYDKEQQSLNIHLHTTLHRLVMQPPPPFSGAAMLLSNVIEVDMCTYRTPT